MTFLEAAHIKDLLAFRRILENPKDDLSWKRILQLLDGIGPGGARQVLHHLQENNFAYQAMTTWKPPPAARSQVQELVRLLLELAGSEAVRPLTAQIERVRRFYAPLFERRYEQPELRVHDLDQLELLAQQASSRTAFLADWTLEPPTSTGDLAGPLLLDEEYVVLSTIHSAKGCEWDVVYLIHAADGVLPSDMSQREAELEEERRLLYVAMTRARNRLYVTFPLRNFHRKHPLGDSHSFAQVSRFLPPEIHDQFERIGVTPVEQHIPVSSPPVGRVSQGVQARLRGLWG